jgi:hypothetical protein
MAFIFGEGFDDYSVQTDIGLSAAAFTTRCNIVTGRGGAGQALQISEPSGLTAGQATYNIPASAAAEVIAGFAMQTTGVPAGNGFSMAQFQYNGAMIFSVVQNAAASLLFFDATAVNLNAYPFDFVTGLIGSAAYENFASYIEVKLTPGNPGSVIVRIDGRIVLNTSGILTPATSTLLANFVQTGGTTVTVTADLGQTVPFRAYINAGLGIAPMTVTAKSGAGNTTWTIAPFSSPNNYSAGTTVYLNPAAGTVNQLQFSTCNPSGGGSALGTWDDLYFCDTSGAQNNDFLGNTRIISQAPSGDGVLLDWTPSSGTVHFSLVNAYPINYGATEVTATTAGNQDSYIFPALPSLGAFTLLRAIQIVDYCESTSGGTDTITGLAYIGGVSYPGTPQPLPAVWQAVPTIMELNPATAAQWTGAGVNGAQFGQKRSA